MLNDRKYVVQINSIDKLVTTDLNNNCTFNVEWDAILPRDVKYFSVRFSCQINGANYKDLTTATGVAGTRPLVLVYTSLINATRNYNTNSKSQNGTLMGVARRDTSGFSYFSYANENPTITVTRPTNNILSVQYFIGRLNAGNTWYAYATSVDSTATNTNADIAIWTLWLEFTPLEDE